jgi:Arc/MetJ family transcription regulator
MENGDAKLPGFLRLVLDTMIDGDLPESSRMFTLNGQYFTVLCWTHIGMVGYTEASDGILSIGVDFNMKSLGMQRYLPELANGSWRRIDGGYVCTVDRSIAAIMFRAALPTIRCCGKAWVNPKSPGEWATLVQQAGYEPMIFNTLPADEGMMLRRTMNLGDQLGTEVVRLSELAERKEALDLARAHHLQTKRSLEQAAQAAPSLLTERTYLDIRGHIERIDGELAEVMAQLESGLKAVFGDYKQLLATAASVGNLQRTKAMMKAAGMNFTYTVTPMTDEGAGQ